MAATARPGEPLRRARGDRPRPERARRPAPVVRERREHPSDHVRPATLPGPRRDARHRGRQLPRQVVDRARGELSRWARDRRRSASRGRAAPAPLLRPRHGRRVLGHAHRHARTASQRSQAAGPRVLRRGDRLLDAHRDHRAGPRASGPEVGRAGRRRGVQRTPSGDGPGDDREPRRVVVRSAEVAVRRQRCDDRVDGHLAFRAGVTTTVDASAVQPRQRTDVVPTPWRPD